MSKNKPIIRTSIGSSKLILSNKSSGLFYFEDNNKYYLIKNGVISDKEFDSIDELMAHIHKNGG